MSGSTYGQLFQISTWGESHGEATGVVIDGCPAGLPLSARDIQPFLDRRRPGVSPAVSSRQEVDQVQILSGVFNGYTTGTPISLLIPNTDTRPEEYEQMKHCFRPGHADFSFQQKYGIRDHRGGGRSSGRETAARVAAGAVASLLLKEFGISITAFTRSLGPIHLPEGEEDFAFLPRSPVSLPHEGLSSAALLLLQKNRKKKDSCGGVVECHVRGLMAGLGQPVFQKLDALLSHAVLSIGGIKGIEFGLGFSASSLLGSQYNDCFFAADGQIHKSSNHGGGILGGISDGDLLLFRAAVKPTPSIGLPQDTVTQTGENTVLSISGRHDPSIVPRVVSVVEAMTALTLADLLLLHASSRLDALKKVYSASFQDSF
ncbi:chorismate synthase [Suipraeoptans intestinalis]|uniref:chorismate synthase n=1 Tax=Suipraeoptans intestinalis TaxID=2606628 RepID=UPI002A74CE30|nr:chorismate synthase [Suipraeoptans intestinalis]MDY3122680.1 chorismate synthase [Suipraeoptans intestinalis]